MATQLALVNKVLRRLREDTVTTVSESTYSQLIAEFINDIKREMEDRALWAALHTDITTNTSSGTMTYDLSASTTERSELLYDNDRWPRVFITTSGYEAKLPQRT